MSSLFERKNEEELKKKNESTQEALKQAIELSNLLLSEMKKY